MEAGKNGNVITEMWRKHNGTRPVHGKLDHHVFAGRKRDAFKQLHVSVEFTKYGNTLFRPVYDSGLLRPAILHPDVLHPRVLRSAVLLAGV